MKKNLFPTILISVLLALWGIILFGYNPSQATVINKSNSSNSLMRGLVGWWTMDGRDTTSVTTSDRSGNGLHATRIGGVRTSIGKIGQSMFFDGVGDDDYLSYTTPTVNTTTISFWYKTNTSTLPNGHRMLLSSFVDSTYVSLSNTSGFVTPFVSFNIGGVQRTLDSNIAVKIGKWTHVVIAWDGSYIRVFVDGILRNTSADLTGGALAGFNGGTSQIGRWQAAAGYQTFGSIDDLRFYNRALAPAEIVQLYTMGGDKINKTDLTRAQLRSGLVGHWTMDGADTTATTSTDKSGRGNDGRRSATGTAVVIGKIGQGMKFISTNNNYVKIASNDTDFITGATGTFSYSFWIKSNSFSGTVLSKSHSCANEGHFNISASGQAIGLSFYSDLDTLGIIYSSGNVLTTGKWNYVTITKQWGTANATKLYVNGEQKTFTPNGSDSTRGTTYTLLKEYIGAQVDITVCSGADGPVAQVFNGSIDDVRIYNRLLNQAEVIELYKMGGGLVVNKTNIVNPTLKTSLLGHWTFDGSDMTNNTTTDRSGNRNDGYLLAGSRPFSAIGKIGQGLRFDGGNRLVKIVTSSSLGVLGNTASVSFWLKPSVVGASTAVLFSYGNGGQYSSGFVILKSEVNLNVYWLSGGPNISVANAFVTSTWMHVAMVNRNGSLVLYKNGVVIGTGTSGGTITNATFNYYIGGEDSAGWFANGIMDDVRIYGRPLAPAEIGALYSMGR